MSNRFFVLSGFNTTYFGLHSLKSFSLKIWNIIPDEVKNSLRLDDFKIRMQQWAPNNITVSSVEVIHNTRIR